MAACHSKILFHQIEIEFRYAGKSINYQFLPERAP
jgi:hypothetical protein